MLKTLSLHGVREHNLKNISLDIPRDALVVITGVSGSGKSTLAFDTIYAEGQRRYVESLSAYSRQFIEQFSKPDLDSIEGLSPAISIDQKPSSPNPRSTVGTVTEIYDFLRLIYARLGKPRCPDCQNEIRPQSVPLMMESLLGLPSGLRLDIYAPVIRGRKGHYQKELREMHQEGFTRVRIDGELLDLADEIKLDRQKQHTIEVLVDRVVLKPGVEARLQEALEIALNLSQGFVQIDSDKGNFSYNEKLACLKCGRGFVELEPRLFSFNSPYGACQACEGLGETLELDPELLIPDPRKSISEGAIADIEPKYSEYFRKVYQTIIKKFDADPQSPFEKLRPEIQKAILYGSDDKKLFSGIIPYLQKRYDETQRESLRESLQQFMVFRTCSVCQGRRLRPEALSVTICGKTIDHLVNLSIADCLKEIRHWKLSEREKKIGEGAVKEITDRLQFLLGVGLSYISLNRTVTSLSGGENQRIRLATQIGSHLVGVLYILDEPSMGLHPTDNEKLLNTLKRLRDSGNSVLVVEHDEETIRQADFIVDMGPLAGRQGGEVVAAGTIDEILQSERSLTGKFLSGRESIEKPKTRRPVTRSITVRGASAHNLKKIDVEIPLGVFVCVTGVSGSGKSTLIKDTLFNWFRHRLYQSRNRIGLVDSIVGADQVDKVIMIDQKPIGRTPRSNPATYTGLFSQIRDVYAQLPQARMRGLRPGNFSFNVKGGRCEACQGGGIKRIEMHFLPDLYVTCEVCGGKRYTPETLDIRYRGASIADTLSLSISEALSFFTNFPRIKHILSVLNDVGLGYLTLGQSATTLSGGEAQRLKLAKELTKRGTGKTLYILDEPTTGLHFADIKHLLQIFSRLVDQGNTVIVIEHQLDVIEHADYLIDLGPGPGDEGGEVVATGTPEAVSANKASETGKFLKKRR